MPIQRELYPPDWEQISNRIRFERAAVTIDGVVKYKCEWCGAVHGDPHPVSGSKTVLHTAHLGVPKPDGTPGDKEDKMDCRDENLAALCQYCHLNYDRPENREKSYETFRRKLHEAIQRQLDAGQLPLWPELEFRYAHA